MEEIDGIMTMFYYYKGTSDTLDWRDHKRVLPPVFNQGSVGDCWAYSTVESLISLNNLYGREPIGTIFSVQQLLDCNNYNIGVDGGYISKGMTYATVYDLATE